MAAFAPYSIGQFAPEAVPAFCEFQVSCDTQNLKLTWSHSDLCANFFSHYFSSAFPLRASDVEGAIPREEMVYSINYLMNELMENVVKFHSGQTVNIAAGVLSDEVGFVVSNEIHEDKVGPFVALLEEITSDDPGLLLLQKIEENAENTEDHGSGLGFLTLMSDYQTRLGWHFESSAAPGWVNVTTMARLNLKTPV